MLQSLVLIGVLGVGQCGVPDGGQFYAGPAYYGYAQPFYGYHQPAYQSVLPTQPQYHRQTAANGAVVFATHDVNVPNATWAWLRYSVGLRYVPVIKGYVPEYTEYGQNGVTYPYYDYTKKIQYASLRTAENVRRPITAELRTPEEQTPAQTVQQPGGDIEALRRRLDESERQLREVREALNRVQPTPARQDNRTSPQDTRPQAPTLPEGMRRPSDVDSTPK